MMQNFLELYRKQKRPFQFAIRLGTVLTLAPLFILTFLARSSPQTCVYVPLLGHMTLIQFSLVIVSLYWIVGMVILFLGIVKWLGSDLLKAVKMDDTVNKEEKRAKLNSEPKEVDKPGPAGSDAMTEKEDFEGDK